MIGHREQGPVAPCPPFASHRGGDTLRSPLRSDAALTSHPTLPLTNLTGLPGSGKEAGESGRALSRDLGFFSVFTTATGTMIGAGIFILPGVAAAGAGPGAALSFLFAGLITGLAALSVSELATAMPKAGGDYYFVSRATGPLVGAMVGLGAWMALVLKGAFALVGLGQYVLHFSPVPILVSAAVAGVALTAVNIFGAKASGALQNLIVVALLAIMVVFAVTGFRAMERATMVPLLPFGWEGVFATTGVVFISYLGVMKAAAISEEVRDPGRNLPAGILASVLVVTLLYVVTMVIVTGVLPLELVVTAPAPLADAAGLFLGALGGLAVAIAGLLATLSTGNAALLSSSRYPFAMARDGLLSSWISQVHGTLRTPVRSILLTGVVMTGLALLLDVEELAKLGGAFGLVVFALVHVSVLILRRVSPPWYRPVFRVPLYPLFPALGALSSLALLPGMGRFSHGATATLLLLAAAWFFHRRRVVRAAGHRLQPEYGLLDRVREIHQVQALEEKRSAFEADIEPAGPALPGTPDEVRPGVVVELEAGRPFRQLLTLGAALANRYRAPLDGVVITEVPMQRALDSGDDSIQPEWRARLDSLADGLGIDLRFRQLLARDRAQALMGLSRAGARIVLMDWRSDFRASRLIGSYVDRVMRRSAARVGVLKYRGHKAYDRILVATAGSPYATAEVEVADAIASFSGGKMTFMMVLPPSASEARERQARSYLETLAGLTESPAELLVVRGEDVAAEIVRVGEDHDLILLGASREMSLRTMFGRHVVGRIADEVAERARSSVLLTRDPRMGRRLSGRLAWGYARLRGWVPYRADPQGREDADDETRLAPFPRRERKDRGQ